MDLEVLEMYGLIISLQIIIIASFKIINYFQYIILLLYLIPLNLEKSHAVKIQETVLLRMIYQKLILDKLTISKSKL